MENARIVFISSLELVGYCFGLSQRGDPRWLIVLRAQLADAPSYLGAEGIRQ
jgi:hypothetical protein